MKKSLFFVAISLIIAAFLQYFPAVILEFISILSGEFTMTSNHALFFAILSAITVVSFLSLAIISLVFGIKAIKQQKEIPFISLLLLLISGCILALGTGAFSGASMVENIKLYDRDIAYSPEFTRYFTGRKVLAIVIFSLDQIRNIFVLVIAIYLFVKNRKQISEEDKIN